MMPDLVSADQFARLPERYQRRAREIAARVAAIDALLVPCSKDDIRDAVGRLRSQFRNQPDTDAAEFATEFKAACLDLPAWALNEAANDFLWGRVDNHTGQYMPTCAEFAKRAREILVPFLAERSSLRTEASKLIERARDDHHRHLIDMERQDPKVRARVAAIIDALVPAPKPIVRRQIGLSEERQERLDALKKPRQFESKLAETNIVKGKKSA